MRAVSDSRRLSPSRRLGVLVFGFFLVKGLAWLVVPWLLLESVR